MDLYTRMIKELMIQALRTAYFPRKAAPGLLHQSDRGSQYCSHAYQNLLKDYGMLTSMSPKGNCRDNAPMESFFNSLKNERVFHPAYLTREHVQRDLFEYLEVFYNRSRRHSALRYQSSAAKYAA